MVLKDSRLTKGVTQEQVARALGISRVSVYQHEAGIKFPRKRLQKKYEEYYQSTYNWDLILKDGDYSELTIKRNTPKTKKYKNKMPKRTKFTTLDNRYGCVEQALYEAEDKHPNFPDYFPNQYAILVEEVGEIGKAWNDFQLSDLNRTAEQKFIKEVRKELAQSAAMCIRILENLSTRYD